MDEQLEQSGSVAATGRATSGEADGQGTLRLHLLAENARGPVTVRIDGTEHQLEAGTPAVVHELPVRAGAHRVELLGKVLGGATGRCNGLVEVAAGQTGDHYYSLPVVPWLRGELQDEPDICPGREWRIVAAAVLALVGAVYLVWFGWLLIAG